MRGWMWTWSDSRLFHQLPCCFTQVAFLDVFIYLLVIFSCVSENKLLMYSQDLAVIVQPLALYYPPRSLLLVSQYLLVIHLAIFCWFEV